MSEDFVRPIEHLEMRKVRDVPRERAVRLFGGGHLQFRAPLLRANRSEGEDFIVATAHCSPEDLRALRDAIDRQLSGQADVEAVYRVDDAAVPLKVRDVEVDGLDTVVHFVGVGDGVLRLMTLRPAVRDRIVEADFARSFGVTTDRRILAVGETPEGAIRALARERHWGEVEVGSELCDSEGEYPDLAWGRHFAAGGTSFKAAGCHIPGGAALLWWK